MWPDCRVMSREEVEGGVGGEDSTGVVEVVEEGEAEVALRALLVRGGLDVELSRSILSMHCTAEDKYCKTQRLCTNCRRHSAHLLRHRNLSRSLGSQ